MSLYLTDETLQFLRPCFDYDAINRPKARLVGWDYIYLDLDFDIDTARTQLLVS